MRFTALLSRARGTRALLLAAAAALSAACADASATGPDGSSGSPDGSGSGSGGNVPSSIVGSWKAGTISSLGFWDTHTGDYLGTAGGIAIFFKFQPNGGYTMQLYVMTRSYGCVTEAWTQLQGTVTFDGDGTFVTHPTVGRYKASDNCIARNNFDRAATSAELDGQRLTHYWSFEVNQTDGKTYLMIGRSPDTRSFFSRDQ
jgi:hypothetical protein